MLAFEVHLNGKRICTAGIGKPGVLTSILTWVLGDGTASRKGQGELYLRVGGLINRPHQHVHWLSRRLRRGDKVSIRIIEADVADRPKRQRSEKPAERRERRRHQQALVLRMAKQFGWKVVK